MKKILTLLLLFFWFDECAFGDEPAKPVVYLRNRAAENQALTENSRQLSHMEEMIPVYNQSLENYKFDDEKDSFKLFEEFILSDNEKAVIEEIFHR